MNEWIKEITSFTLVQGEIFKNEKRCRQKRKKEKEKVMSMWDTHLIINYIHSPDNTLVQKPKRVYLVCLFVLVYFLLTYPKKY